MKRVRVEPGLDRRFLDGIEDILRDLEKGPDPAVPATPAVLPQPDAMTEGCRDAIRALWEEVARDLGDSRDAARKRRLDLAARRTRPYILKGALYRLGCMAERTNPALFENRAPVPDPARDEFVLSWLARKCFGAALGYHALALDGQQAETMRAAVGAETGGSLKAAFETVPMEAHGRLMQMEAARVPVEPGAETTQQEEPSFAETRATVLAYRLAEMALGLRLLRSLPEGAIRPDEAAGLQAEALPDLHRAHGLPFARDAEGFLPCNDLPVATARAELLAAGEAGLANRVSRLSVAGATMPAWPTSKP